MKKQKVLLASNMAPPRRFRWPTYKGRHPNSRITPYEYGVYFPGTDLVVTDMGCRGTGEPDKTKWPGIEWLDTEYSNRAWASSF